MTLGRVPAGTDAQHQAELEGVNDARTGMPHGIPRGAMCVQRFDDSLNSAIHTTYRISLRSSSMPEPRDPLLKVVNNSLPIKSEDTSILHKVVSRGPMGRACTPPRDVYFGTHSQGWIPNPKWGRRGNDPSAGSPTERLSSPKLVSQGARLYLKQGTHRVPHPLPLSL